MQKVLYRAQNVRLRVLCTKTTIFSSKHMHTFSLTFTHTHTHTYQALRRTVHVHFVLYTALFARQSLKCTFCTVKRTFCALYGTFCTSYSQTYILCSIRQVLYIKLSRPTCILYVNIHLLCLSFFLGNLLLEFLQLFWDGPRGLLCL